MMKKTTLNIALAMSLGSSLFYSTTALAEQFSVTNSALFTISNNTNLPTTIPANTKVATLTLVSDYSKTVETQSNLSGYLLNFDMDKFDVSIESGNDKLILQRKPQSGYGNRIITNDNTFKVSRCREQGSSAIAPGVNNGQDAICISFDNDGNEISPYGAPYRLELGAESVEELTGNNSGSTVTIYAADLNNAFLVATNANGERDNRLRLQAGTTTGEIDVYTNVAVNSDIEFYVRAIDEQTGTTFLASDNSGGYDSKRENGSNTNNPPTNLSLVNQVTSINRSNSTTTLGTLSATDVDGDNITYSIKSGANSSYFSVNSNSLKVSSLGNYTSNTISVTVIANDGNDGTTEAFFEFAVTDGVSPPHNCTLPTTTYGSRTLEWEVKTSSGLHNATDRFKWYNSSSNYYGDANGYFTCSYSSYPDAKCNTEEFVTRVNSSGYCGAASNPWRLPSKEELSTLKNSNVNLVSDAYYWSSTEGVLGAGLYAFQIQFSPSYVERQIDKVRADHVILVRNKQ